MGQVCAAAAAVGLLLLVPSEGFGQTGSGLSILSYQLVSEQRVSGSQSDYTYRATLVNTGAARSAVTATVSSVASNIEVLQGNVHFSPVPANGQTQSLDTFTISVDRTAPFSLADLRWSFVAPYANAGPNQTATVGSTVTLNGSGSSNPSGVGYLVYTWTFLSRPAGSSARLANATTVMSTFQVDVAGTYIAQLTVTNGAGSDTATVSISTANTPPVANAGPNQTVATGSTVILNGSGSSDVNGDPLTYLWALTQRPTGSTAVLAGTTSVSPSFVADKAGTYVAQLTVNDGKVNSSPATVAITTQNTAPVSNAGPNQAIATGAFVQLNGSASTDVDGDQLTYQWSLITVPSGSTAALSNAATVNPSFTADRAGTYVAQLIVNDGKVSSLPSTVTITTGTVQAPTANPGSSQTVKHGSLVTLNGSGTDPQGRSLTFQWSLLSKPSGSTAALSGATTPQPTFVPDLPGNYVAQLIVNNGFVSSAPATVTVTTTNSMPVAHAGISQSVAVGSTVTLNGVASADADGDALTFSWSFASRPEGSNAALSAANSFSPTFIADVSGTYVAQLIVSDKFTSSAPATVTISASDMTITLTPDPLNLVSNSPGTLTITLGSPAGAFGQQINLAAIDPAVVSVPRNVVIPGNQTSVVVTVTPAGATGSTNLTASAPGFRPGTATVVVGVPTVSVSLASSAIGLTRTTTGTVTLDAPAPSTGVRVNLLSNPSGVVTLQPASVDVPGGSTTGSFTVTGTAEGVTSITASSAGYSSGPAAQITVGKLGQITLQSNVTVAPGKSAPIQVALLTPAPVGGVTVTLTSSNPSIVSISPASVQIPAGATASVVPPQVTGVTFGSATITASSPGMTGDSQAVTVSASLSFSPASVTVGAGGTQNLALTVSAPAPAGGLLVNLSSTATATATVPASVSIPQGATTVNVPVTGVAAGTATISAAPGSLSVTGANATVTVVVLGSITMPAGGTVGLGQSLPAQIALSANAPSGGLTVSLASSNTSRATLSSATVTIPAGSNAPVSQPQINGIGIGPVTITASAPGFGTTSRTIQVTASLSFAPGSLTLTGAGTQNLTLTLSGPAPAGGLTVNLSSDSTAVASVPSTVTIPQNTTTATVPVSGVGSGSTVVRASAAGIVQATANVTVQTAGAIGLPANLRIAPGQTAAFAVTLPSAASSTRTVSLVSSDTSVVTISPATVSIAAGQTQPSQQPQITGIKFGSASITASATGYTAGSQSVQVGATLAFATQNLIISAANQNVALNLSAAAPVGGVVVTLTSSNTATATVPASVTIPQGLATVSVPVKALAPGSAMITASTNAPNVTGATMNVTVQSVGGIILPAGLSVPMGQSRAFNLTLPVAAPAGGVTVTLNSSDTGKVTISPATVLITAGQTQPAQQPQITGVAPGTANISASATGFGPATQAVQVTGTLGFNPNALTITGGTTGNLSVVLSGPAPAGGVTLALSSNNTAVATVPPNIIVPQNASSATVTVTGVSVGSAVIRATGTNLGEATATVTVTQAVDIILPDNLAVAPGASVVFPISLARPAQQTTFVSLTSSDPSKATLTLQNLLINTGQTTPTSQPRINGVAAGSVTITASAPALTTATTTVAIGYRITFSPADVTIAGTATQQLILTLSAPAPQNGLAVNLTSSNTGVARVPASVSFAQGATSVNVPVTGVAPGTAVIRASSTGLAEATGNVTVVTPGSITLPANTTVQLGRSIPFPITLTTPAPASGVTVMLSSSNTGRLTISPSTVSIPAGQTQPASQPVISGVNVGAANINAAAPGFSAASTTVQVTATVNWNKQSVTMRQGTTTMLLLALSSSAPWVDGIPVTLSSSNSGVAGVQSTITFYPDGSDITTLSIPVTAVAAGTAVITAVGTNIPAAAVTINVVGPVTITTTGLSNGAVNSPYSQPVVASGGVPPYTWALTSGTLPAGLNLNTTTGVISGTPTAVATNTPLTFRVTDSSSPAESATRSLMLTITQPVAASIVVAGGSGQSAAINTAFATRLAATVRDAGGNPVSGATVTFTAPPSGASGGFTGGNTAVTNTSGVATSNVFTANATIGTYNVTATVPGVQTPATFALTNTAGPPASISVSGGSAQSATINTAFANRLSATVRDARGNPVSGVTVVFSAPATGASATFAGGASTAVTNASGVATSAIATANSTIGQYTVLASINGVTGTAGFVLTNTTGPPASITATGGSGQSATINTTFPLPLVATVRDAGGNPVSGVTVTFTPPSSGASGSFTGGANTAVTNASGVATSAVLRANTTIGSYSVNASVSSVQTMASFALSNTTVPPASITMTSGSGQSAAINTAFASPLVVTVRDSGNNPVSGVTVTFNAPTSGASATFAAGVKTAVTNASGVATSAAVTANSTVGSYAITASVSGVQTLATFTLTNTAGPASSIAASGGLGQSTTVNTSFGFRLTATVTDAGGNPVSGATVTFTAPSSGATLTFTGGVNTAVTNASGVATSASFTANGTAGSYSVTASASGVQTPATFALTNTAGPAASITATAGSGQSAVINQAFANQLTATVKDVGGNPVSGVTVTFTAPAAGARGTFAGGANTAVTNASGVATSAIFTANSTAGQYNVTAAVPGVQTPAAFTLTNTPGPPSSISVTSGSGQSATAGTAFGNPLVVSVRDAGSNPLNGVTVTFSPPASGASGTFAGGVNTAVTNASGVATSRVFTANVLAGSYNVIASVAGLQPTATFALENISAGPPLTLTSATAGKNRQAQVSLTLPNPAPAPLGQKVKIRSLDPAKVLIAGRPGDSGATEIEVTIGEGLTTVTGIYVQALTDTGSVQIEASATGFTSAFATVTLTPSGFILAGPNGMGGSFSISQGNNVQLTVSAARLNASLTFAELQQVRGGVLATVEVSNSAPTQSGVSPASVSIMGGNTSATTTFAANPSATGAATLTAVPPTGYSQPAQSANAVTANFIPSGIVVQNVTVGQNLQTAAVIVLNSPVPGGPCPGSSCVVLPVSIVSSDSSKLLFATSPNAGGTNSITLTLESGRTTSPPFYVQGLQSSGSIQYTVTASGYGAAIGTVTLARSGFVISGPLGLGADFFTTVGSENSDLTIQSALLDSAGNFVAQQAVRGGLSPAVTVTSGNLTIGTITNSPVNIAGGTGSAITQFDPAAQGTAVLSVSTPAGFSTPTQYAAISATVRTPNLSVSNVSIGRMLQTIGTVLVGESAPRGGVVVTLTSKSPHLILSNSETTAGTAAITVTVPEGQSSAMFILQALTDTGTGTYTATAPGYVPKDGVVTFRRSGIVLEGPFGFGFALFASLNAGDQPVTVSTAMLNENDAYVMKQQLAGGQSLDIALRSSTPAVGTIVSPLRITGGSESGTTLFTPVAPGQTTVSVLSPGGYTLPSNFATLLANVN